MADVTPSTLPPQAVLYQLATGHYVSRALEVAARLGIADLLKDGPGSADDLATATGMHAASLRRVLRLLATVGVFVEDERGAFALTPLGDCLRNDVPGSARNLVRLMTGQRTQDAWRELDWCVRTGEPAFRKRGITDHFAEMASDPDTTAVFDAAMADYTKLAAVAVAAMYDFAPLRTLVDVGGGNGTLLIGILHAHDHLHGIVYDQEHAVARARDQIARRGLADRCGAVAGDFFAEVPSGGDAYLLKHVIHDWDDERATTILRNCRRAMGGRGMVLIIEGVYPPRVDQSPASRGAAANDVNMLVNTGGRQRAEEEFRALFDAAGFALTKIVPTPINISILEGTPRE